MEDKLNNKNLLLTDKFTGAPEKTSHWLECHQCDGSYDLDLTDNQMTCNKCGCKIPTVIENDKIRFGGSQPSFAIHVRPGDRVHLLKEYREGKKLRESVLHKKEQSTCKSFETFKLGNKAVDIIQVNFILDVIITLKDTSSNL